MNFDDETPTGSESDAGSESVDPTEDSHESDTETAVVETADAGADSETTAEGGAETESADGADGADGADALPGGTPRMALEVDISDTGPCQKHVVIKVPRKDIDAVHGLAVGELIGTAEVPGFRKGHVPAELVAKRFRQELADEVKQKLLIGSLEQLAVDHDLDPINEPNLDVDMIEIPDEGDFEYEFDVEVRPDFDLPDYKGLKIDRPVREVTDGDVDDYLQQFLLQYAHLHDHDGAAGPGDAIVADLEFTHDGQTTRTIEGQVLHLWPVLRFRDAQLDGFAELMTGVTAGEQRGTELTVALEAENVAMRGETVSLTLKVEAVKQTHLPDLDEELLERLGVDDEASLREALKSSLERQAEFQQRQATRSQVLEQITESANWELPEELVSKQTENALRREILEMQQAGFTSQEIQARENEIRQNAVSTTRQAMKEHFVLDRIAETEEIDITAADLDSEIQLMAMQSGESPRRLRARLIKSGMIENLEAQVRERKSIDIILEHAEFNDTEAEPPVQELVTTVEQSICQSSSYADAAAAEEATSDTAAEEQADDDAAAGTDDAAAETDDAAAGTDDAATETDDAAAGTDDESPAEEEADASDEASGSESDDGE